MNGGPWDDPDLRAFADEAERRMVPMVRDSSIVAPLWTGAVDVKIAAEIGVALLLDKPIVLLVKPGTAVPDKLVRVADRIIEADPTTTAGREALGAAITAALEELDL